MVLYPQPLEEDQKTDTTWLKSALKEIISRLKESDKKMHALKNSIDEARVSLSHIYISAQNY